jgi:hypothetical protein
MILGFTGTIYYYKYNIATLENKIIESQHIIDTCVEANKNYVKNIDICNGKIKDLTNDIEKINQNCDKRIEKLRKDGLDQCKIGDTSKDKKLTMCLDELSKCKLANNNPPITCDDKVQKYEKIMIELNEMIIGANK